MFIHVSDYMDRHPHATVADARECEEAAIEAMYEDPSCSICDATGHGYPGGGPCPLEVSEIVRWETDQDELRALAFA